MLEATLERDGEGLRLRLSEMQPWFVYEWALRACPVGDVLVAQVHEPVEGRCLLDPVLTHRLSSVKRMPHGKPFLPADVLACACLSSVRCRSGRRDRAQTFGHLEA